MIAAPDILNASVLIVDDQESNISLIEQLLSETGYTSVTPDGHPKSPSDGHFKIPHLSA